MSINQQEMEDFLQDGEVTQLPQLPINIFERGLTKSDVPVLANILVEHALEKGNPLQVAEGIKIIMEICEAVKGDKRLRDYVLDELAKNNKCFNSLTGAKIEPLEAGGRYDYSSCNDQVWNELETAKKAREKFLRTIPKEGIEVRNGDELVTILPPVKHSGVSTYKITLQK